MTGFQKERFDILMTNAQLAYGNGDLTTSADLYAGAYDMAKIANPTNWMDATRAARGAFESRYRLNANEGDLTQWRRYTVGAMENVVANIVGCEEWTIANLRAFSSAELQGVREPLREVVQTNTVLGKIGLRRLISGERQTANIDSADKDSMFYNLRLAGNILQFVEDKDSPIDQYRINWECPAFYAQRLYGSRAASVGIAVQAAMHWRLSESLALPTAANISEEHRATSRHRAKGRAMSMAASTLLPRRAVLAIASRVV